MKIEKLVKKMKRVKDPRRRWGKKRQKQEDILVIGFCTIVSGGEDFTDMEDFSREREEWLKDFLELPNGIPDADTFRRVFERVNPQELSKNLRGWVEYQRERKEIVGVDGKTIRSSSAKHKAYYVVSAFVAENHITLGELKTEEKSNEITAVPELLDMLDIEGAIVIADAMSCQKDIARKIVEKEANYVLSVKGNQPTLLADIQEYFDTFSKETFKSRTLEKGHGRIKTREYFLESDV